MKAIVLGATGATGKDMMQCLLAEPDVEHVLVLARRTVVYNDPRVEVLVVDFDKPETWAKQVEGDVLYSMLGTTRATAGSKEAQWRVDFTYQYEVAKAAKENGVRTMVLMSAMGANAQSTFFYSRMKGELEDKVLALGFERTVIVQPPSLIRKDTDRPSERLSIGIIRAFNRIYLMRRLTPVTTEAVAKVMLSQSRIEAPAVSYITFMAGQVVR